MRSPWARTAAAATDRRPRRCAPPPPRSGRSGSPRFGSLRRWDRPAAASPTPSRSCAATSTPLPCSIASSRSSATSGGAAGGAGGRGSSTSTSSSGRRAPGPATASSSPTPNSAAAASCSSRWPSLSRTGGTRSPARPSASCFFGWGGGPYSSPAKAGAQLTGPSRWAPASAGAQSAPAQRLLELVLAPAADQQPAFQPGAEGGVIIGQEFVVVAPLVDPGLVADGARDGLDRVGLPRAKHVLEGLKLVDAVEVERGLGERSPRPSDRMDEVGAELGADLADDPGAGDEVADPEPVPVEQGEEQENTAPHQGEDHQEAVGGSFRRLL